MYLSLAKHRNFSQSPNDILVISIATTDQGRAGNCFSISLIALHDNLIKRPLNGFKYEI